jgi:hypothetical protein
MRRREFVLTGVAAALAADTKQQPLDLRAGGQTAAQLYFGEPWDKPFLYPIRTVSGKVLSRGYPMEPQEGDSKDHTWHRGFWYGHGIINGADFWREQGREKTARLIPKAKPRVQRSSVSVDLAMTPVSGPAMGTIREEFRLEDRNQIRLIDTTITIFADAGQSLKFGDTDDGGYAFRLTEAFREDRGAQLRNSEGQRGTDHIWGKPARWVDYSAVIDSESRGVTMFDHPSNLRHPTRWHARGYGLCAANPFALKSFTKDPVADGSYTLPSGEKLVSRYRTVIHEGLFETAEVERLYAQYAKS